MFRSRSIFGWDLPPGCTMADIDRAFGDEPTMLELFADNEKGNLSEEDNKTLDELLDMEQQRPLIERILQWASKQGYDTSLENESYHWDWMIGEILGMPNPFHNPFTHSVWEDCRNKILEFLEKQRGGFSETAKRKESVSSETDDSKVSSK